MNSSVKRWLRRAVGLSIVLPLIAVSACEQRRPFSPVPEFDQSVRDASRPSEVETADTPAPGPAVSTRVTVRPPAPPLRSSNLEAPAPRARLTGEPIDASFDQMSLTAFINAVFGETLNLPFEIAPEVAQRRELVTLRTGGPQEPPAFLQIVREVLASYGLEVVEREGLYRIATSESLRREVPTVIRSRAAPEVPVALRPVFQFVDLRSEEPNIMGDFIAKTFKDKLTVQPLPGSNAIILLGLPDDVRSAVEMVQILDQPRFTKSRSARIQPAYWSADKLARKLYEILTVEGYRAAYGLGPASSIALVPAERVNAILVFAPDQETLDHVIGWARDLDEPSAFGQTTDIFFYPVQNTNAGGIAQVVNSLSTAGGGPAAAAGAPEVADAARVVRGKGLVVDPIRNALIFEGTAEEYSRLLPLLRRLDQPAREVLIEVTIAEVTLDDTTRFGIEWLIKDVGIDSSDLTFGTLGALGIGADGFNATVLKSGDVRAVLNAFASNNRVNVLATPRVVARSGGQATINVGTEVPIITSQTTSQVQSEGDTGILQTIQYRQTGVLLTVSPVVHSGQRIDLEVSQEFSESRENPNQGISSPLILNRSVVTSLSLADGATAVIGGLIQDNRTVGETGIPFLKDIPIIGNAFKTQSNAIQKTELMLLITPYIIDNVDEAKSIADALKTRIDNLSATPLETTGFAQPVP